MSQTEKWWKPQTNQTLGFKNWFTHSKELTVQCELDNNPISSKTTSEPIFFENSKYGFSIESDDKEFIQKFKNIADWIVRPNIAFYEIKTSNNVGWHTLPLPDGLEFKFLVYPTKMDYWNDYNQLFTTIEEEYPLWLLTLDGANHDAKRTKQPHERFWLLWLKQFSSLWDSLTTAIKYIENQPHNRLLPYTRHLRADRITGKLSPKLEERIQRDKKNGNLDSRKYSIQKRSLQVDTPENRYVKFVMSRCVQGLNHLEGLINKEPSGSQTLSEINEWKKSLRKHQLGALFSKVGNIPKLDGESLVLQQRAGYSDVNRIWGELKHYLDLFGNQAELSLRTIDQLYEVWCLLEVKKQLEGLGFVEDKTEKRKAIFKKLKLQRELKDGVGSAFNLIHKNSEVKVKLAHEPWFGKNKKNDNIIKSYTTINKPDIFLEATFPDDRSLIWLFDAKYRIYTSKTYQNPNAKQAEEDLDEAELSLFKDKDLIPPDALNQMHRYRDVLIHENSELKSRPVVAAFCLYPGFYPDQVKWADRIEPTDYNSKLEDSQDFPYAESIHNVGVGAFPLLPGQNDDWLKSYLSEQLLGCEIQNAKDEKHWLQNFNTWQSDHVLHQESINIAPKGLYLNAFKETVLIVWDSRNDFSNPLYKHLDVNKRTLFHCKNNSQAPAIRRLKDCAYILVLNNSNKKPLICYEVENDSFEPKERNKLTQELHGVRTVKGSEIYRTVKIQPANIPITQWKVDEIIEMTKTRGWFRYAELGDIYK
ncbi:restriction endonuclease-like protein [Fibrobacterales bacterium]|nr:restriction endonuclease-like protein [Fibrobacterales bacterium]